MSPERTAPGTSPASGSDPAAGRTREGWSVPRPERTPRRTLWPAAAALGIVLFFWGIVTAYLIAGVGLVLLGVAVLGWIGEVRHER
jgi:hypothetical protein